MTPQGNTTALAQFAYLMVGILASMVLLKMGSSLLIPFWTAVILSLAIFPAVRKLERLGLHRVIGITLTLLLIFVVISLLVFLIGAQINSFIKELPTIVKRFEGLLQSVQQFIQNQFEVAPENQLTLLRDNIMQSFNTGVGFVTSTISTTSNILFYLSIIPVYMFFMIYYYEIWAGFFISLVKNEKESLVKSILVKTVNVIKSYVGGLFFVIIIVAILNSVGFLILGIEYAIFFGSLIALLSIIPYFGLLMGSTVAILYIFLTTDSLFYPLGILVIVQIVQFLEGNFITPYVMGSQIKLNALAIIFGLLLGSFTWGAMGMILSVPTLAIVKLICDSIDGLKPFGRLLGVPEGLQEKL